MLRIQRLVLGSHLATLARVGLASSVSTSAGKALSASEVGTSFAKGREDELVWAWRGGSRGLASSAGEGEETGVTSHDLIPEIMPSIEDLLKGSGEDEDDAIRNTNAEVTILPRVVNKYGHSYGLGKRKSAVARAWLRPGSGQITVNGVPAAEYFRSSTGGLKAAKPFAVTGTVDQFDAHCKVKGGGTTGQAEAVSLAISRAIQFYDPPKRVALKVYNLLTRDNREVERKKPGKAKARKSFQWVKR
ncbi:ribosomal protein S9 [Chloropicon primus]|uniref:Small ribosomal subunit protein uS9c n=1 Tax=Chloropicon primus TaxID=1764295 RepID=A0A5B8MU79_9CHLO|nr:ribosomal protein S9 [Chloropicon primus]UPR03546.1 ribosomal protein S9 [Chloropicon primus]|eukprot:QDZ24338.1 ribosomal protein S9 [Chloropicon primus]